MTENYASASDLKQKKYLKIPSLWSGISLNPLGPTLKMRWQKILNKLWIMYGHRAIHFCH